LTEQAHAAEAVVYVNVDETALERAVARRFGNVVNLPQECPVARGFYERIPRRDSHGHVTLGPRAPLGGSRRDSKAPVSEAVPASGYASVEGGAGPGAACRLSVWGCTVSPHWHPMLKERSRTHGGCVLNRMGPGKCVASVLCTLVLELPCPFQNYHVVHGRYCAYCFNGRRASKFRHVRTSCV